MSDITEIVRTIVEGIFLSILAYGILIKKN